MSSTSSPMTVTRAREVVALWHDHAYNIEKLAHQLSSSPSTMRRTLDQACDALGMTRIELKKKESSSSSKEDDLKLIKAWESNHHINEHAADELDIPRSTFRRKLKLALRRQGKSKPALAPAEVPEGMVSLKSTVQYDAEGNVVQEWRRLFPEGEAMQALADRLCEQVAGKAPKLPPAPKTVVEDLMLEIPLFDVHVGQLSWDQECNGNDYNSSIARKLIVGHVTELCRRAGPVGKVLLILGGDFLHADNRAGTTEKGTRLDVDTRQEKVWDVAVDAVVQAVEVAASHAKLVSIVVLPGNHDFQSSLALGRVLEAFWRNDRRVEVIRGPKTRHYIQHGKVLIGLSHGDILKPDSLPNLMAEEVPQLWAATNTRVWHLGHYHTSRTISWKSCSAVRGTQVEYLENIAPQDQWSTSMGFSAGQHRGLGFLWNAKVGLTSRFFVYPTEILGA